jgi:hypothetical protein
MKIRADLKMNNKEITVTNEPRERVFLLISIPANDGNEKSPELPAFQYLKAA